MEYVETVSNLSCSARKPPSMPIPSLVATGAASGSLSSPSPSAVVDLGTLSLEMRMNSPDSSSLLDFVKANSSMVPMKVERLTTIPLEVV